ncbi:LysR family transcriptional regulator [Motilimonas pumila]|uniref:LysR family transcriptional regulator n=1 Tax=Motilimonas pumila TaxID=2303987 RepID=A0A418YDY9_9GAMM|nr:LysR family transcriptional regulator [Motilimonas pumila]RJG42755.1 LysR family transcriptional regulator [Motilimonas pumila]
MNTVKLAPLLLIFADVAKLRSFTAAAKKLGMSKSAVSQQIKRLEQAVDLQLLARHTRGVVLTSAGEALLSRSELLSEQLRQVVLDVQEVKQQPSGRFKVSAPPFFERNIIVPALRQLCFENPKLTPELAINGRWQDLVDHDLDVAIFGGHLQDSNYKARLIGQVQDVFCASQGYLQQAGQIGEINDLSQHRFIATPWQNGKLQLLDEHSQQEVSFMATAYAQTNNLNTLIDMVKQGMGVGLLPEFVAKQRGDYGAMGLASNEDITQVLPNLMGQPWHFYFLHQYQHEKPSHIDRFYQLVCYYFNKLNPSRVRLPN